MELIYSSSKQAYSVTDPHHCRQNNYMRTVLGWFCLYQQLSQGKNGLGIYPQTTKLEGDVCLQISQIGSYSKSLF